jgi:hypothetical protein
MTIGKTEIMAVASPLRLGPESKQITYARAALYAVIAYLLRKKSKVVFYAASSASALAVYTAVTSKG